MAFIRFSSDHKASDFFWRVVKSHEAHTGHKMNHFFAESKCGECGLDISRCYDWNARLEAGYIPDLILVHVWRPRPHKGWPNYNHAATRAGKVVS